MVLARPLSSTGRSNCTFPVPTGRSYQTFLQQVDHIIFSDHLFARLKLGICVTTIPTIGFNIETVRHKKKGIDFTFWDLGGGDKIRPLLRHYYPDTNAIVYVVDSTDPERFLDVRQELREMMVERQLALAHLLVLANKSDLEQALSPEELWDELDLTDLAADEKSERLNMRFLRATVLPICATSGQGCFEALDWLANVITSGM